MLAAILMFVERDYFLKKIANEYFLAQVNRILTAIEKLDAY